MILTTFFLPPDSGERIGVVVTVLLVFALYLEIIGHMLPKSSNAAPALAQFYRFVMIESACTLISTCFVLYIHFKGTGRNVRRVPYIIRLIFIKYFGSLFCLYLTKSEKLCRALLRHDILNNALSVINTGDNTKKTKHNEATEVSSILDELRIITTAIQDEKREAEVLGEWKFLAKIFDRIFFVIFLIIFVVSSCVVLLRAMRD